MAKSRFTFALCCALGFAGVAAAETGATARTSFSIAPGSLDASLEALARQSRIQILYPPRLVAGRRSGRLAGELTPAEALERLLQGSGLEAVAVNANTFVLKRRGVARAPRPAPAPPPADEGRVALLETVQVTGSRIQRQGLEALTPSPLTLIDREEIEASGHQTLFDLLRTRPGMVGHHPVDVAAEGGQGVQQPFATAATTSLNALGPRATLFLVDGRRVANYGLISSDLGGLTDLDSIPLSMVERIEILRGGASAIYGADAMAGVVNIILRREFQGSQVLTRYGISDSGDAEERRVAASTGFDTARGGHVFLSGDRFERDGLRGSQREWRTRDLTRFGLGDWRFPLGYRDEMEEYLRPACPTAGGLGAACLFDPTRYGSLQPEQERTSLYGRWQQPLGEAAMFDLSVRASRAHQVIVGAPFYARITLPEAMRETPEDYYIDYAFFDVGRVRSHNEAHNVDVAAGVHLAWGAWDWTLQGARSTHRVTSRVDGLVRLTSLFDALDRGEYRFGAPDNPPEVLAAISPDVNSRGRSTREEIGLQGGGPWFALRGGDAQVAVGIEVSRDSLRHEPDPLLIEADVALAPQKIRVDSRRVSSALFAELSLPLTHRLHADVAARVDHSDRYGTRLSPKVGVKWKARDAFTVRGTAATGYRAPSLFETRRPVVFETYDVVPRRPEFEPCGYVFRFAVDDYCIVERGAIENPDLGPETSRSYTLGFVWTPLADFTFELDRFRIERRNEILPGNALIDPQAFPRSLRRDEDGFLVGIDDYFENVGRTDVRGWEMQARYQLDTERFGRYSLVVAGQYLDRLERQGFPGAPALNHAGHGAPDRSALASLQWSYADWATTLSARALGPVRLAEAGQACPPVYASAGRCTTPGYTTWDLNLAYAGFKRWRFSLNIRNLLDRKPVNYDVFKGGYDIAYDDPRGRYLLVGASYRFP